MTPFRWDNNRLYLGRFEVGFREPWGTGWHFIAAQLPGICAIDTQRTAVEIEELAEKWVLDRVREMAIAAGLSCEPARPVDRDLHVFAERLAEAADRVGMSGFADAIREMRA